MTMACPFLVLDMTLDRKDGLNAQAREVVYRVHPEWPQGQIVEKVSLLNAWILGALFLT